MNHINQTAGIDNIKDRIVKTKRCFIFCIAIIFLSIGEDLNLSEEELPPNALDNLSQL